MTSKVVNSIDLPDPACRRPSNAQSRVGERLDLVEHVKVRVSVSLGETEIPISQPVRAGRRRRAGARSRGGRAGDIRVNDRVIARGVLVAVGDQFGVRITEIESR